MPTITPWTKGKHLTLVRVTGFIVGVDQILTASATSTLTDLVDYIRINSDPVHEMIQTVTRSQANYEITLEDGSLEIGEILTNKVTPTFVSKLPTLFSQYDRFYVEATRGGQPYTYWGTRGAFADGITNFGKNVAVGTFKPFDPGGTTPQIVYTP